MKNASDSVLDLILFTVGKQICAVDMADLLEVTSPVPVTPLPFVPHYVDGLVNVAGQIMPQINAMRLLEQSAESLHTILVLAIDALHIALSINQVLENIQISSDELKPFESPKAFLKAHYHDGKRSIHVLDLNALKTIVKSDNQSTGKAGFLGKISHNQTVVEKHFDYFIFQMGNKRYAFRLEQVDEIVELEQLYHQPRAPEVVSGVSLIRGEPRLMLNLSSLLKQASQIKRQVAVITELDNAYIGLVIDHLIGIESIVETAIRGDVQQSIECQDGLLASVVDIPSLLKPHLMALAPFIPASTRQNKRQQVKQVELLRFVLNGDVYALQTEFVRRIVSDKSLEPLLSPKAWILGTTDIEGKIVPVIDLMAQLGYESAQQTLRELIVVDDGKSEWALAIPYCEEIMLVDETAIDKIDDEIKAYVSALVNAKEQLLTILNPLSICRDNQARQVV